MARVPVVNTSSFATKTGIQNSTYVYAADAGVNDSYAITLSPAVTALAAGQVFTFYANTANTGAASLAVNGLTAKTIKKANDQDLATGDIEAGQIVTVAYNGTDDVFEMISQTAATLGDVVGVASSVDSEMALFSGTGGKTLKRATGTGVVRIDSGVVSVDTDVTDLVSAASDTAAGKVELATDAETITGTDTGRAVTPAGLQAKVASETAKGIIEIATAAEINTGTDATRAIGPDQLAGSEFGKRGTSIQVVAGTTDTAVGDGKAYFTIPSFLGGMNLVAVHARVVTAGTTGTLDVQIANVTQAADMLTTKITIDSAETGSDTAATPAVIDTNNDDVATNDLIRIDVDAVHTTAAKGLIVTLVFQLP